MGLFEQDFVLNPTENSFLPHIKLWKRYIVDILILWTGDEASIQQFLSSLSYRNEHLRFTFDNDQHVRNFLDITIKKECGTFETDLYRKPCYRNS